MHYEIHRSQEKSLYLEEAGAIFENYVRLKINAASTVFIDNKLIIIA